MIHCNLCNDRGIIVENDVAKPCSCMKDRLLARKIRNSHLTDKMRGFTFDKFNFDYYNKYYDSAHKSYKAAQDFAKRCARGESPDGIFLTGEVGSGKTYLASCIANYILDRGKEVILLVVPDFLDSIRATFDATKRDSMGEQDLVDEAREIPVLILDDLGAHNYTEWTKNKIYSLLNYRLNNDLPTVITSNISFGDLTIYLGERTASRISELCRPYRLQVEIDIRILMRQASIK